MKIRVIWGALILSGLVMAVPATSSLAQSGGHGMSAPKESVAAGKATRHARPHRAKHRYWRHRGGRHPHFGSRRVGH